MEHLKGRTFAIVDVETSGVSAVFNRVIEIGILRIEDGVCVETYRTCINPGRAVSPWITALTGIRQEELDRAPHFEDVADTVERLLKDAVFVAHNARFDYAFIKNEFKRAGKRYAAKCLCTVRLSRALYPRAKKHDLSTIIARYGFACTERHRAFDDAHVLWQFLQYSHEKHREKLTGAIDALLKRHTLPPFLDTPTIAKLPESPGVYIFYGEGNEVIYVGKSRNIKTRVLSHFSGNHSSTKEAVMTQYVVRVEARETAGELSALLLESSLVKSLKPRYNRQLLKRREIVVARRRNEGHYESLSLERVEGIGVHEYRDILGIFKSVAQAKEYLALAAKRNMLCKKLLGLEKTKGECFGVQIGTCSGACATREDAGAYNARFESAFRARRLKAWPYAGAILIEERRDDIEKHSFVLDNWCLVGDIRTGEDDFEFRATVPEFDHDRYKIFSRYLRDPVNRSRVRSLTTVEFNQFLLAQNGEAVIS